MHARNFKSRRQSSTDSAYESDCDLQSDCFRIVVMGAAAVGKTCLISQFLDQDFRAFYKETVEDIHRRQYVINGADVKLEVLDTAGAYTFPAMRRLAITSGDAFILVFALDNAESYAEVGRVLQDIKQQREDKDSYFARPPVVAVGNKLDCVEEESKCVSRARVELELGCAYVETSAKHGTGIEDVFAEVMRNSSFFRPMLPIHISRPEKSKLRKSAKRRMSVPFLGEPAHFKTDRRQSCVIS